MSNSRYGDDFEYIGNIWGWRISIMGAIFIVIILLVMFGRYRYLVATDSYPESVQDTIELYED